MSIDKTPRASLFVIGITTVLCLNACKPPEPDHETLYFTTADKVKTTLNMELELYTADNDPELYYINYTYYKKNKDRQWAWSRKPEGPWKVFPDQASVPAGLLKVKP